jgi:hypothetical protein
MAESGMNCGGRPIPRATSSEVVLRSVRMSSSKTGRETLLPAARWSLPLVFVLLLAACGSPADNTGIGARSIPAANVGAISFNAAPIADAFAAQLAELNNVQSIGETSANGQLPIDSILTFRQSLVLTYFQFFEEERISGRLDAIATLRNQVASYGVMAPWQRARIIGILNGTTAALNKLRLTVGQEQLVDAVAHDRVKINRLRVLTVVLPQARVLVAAYLLDGLASFYAGQQAALQQAIYAWEANGNDGTAAQAALNDLALRIAIMRRYSAAAIAQVGGLSPSGYPGNRSSLTSARGTLASGQIVGGQAAADAVRTRAALR